MTGGLGSGEWFRFSRKATVEGSWQLDVNRLARSGCFVRFNRGSITWNDNATDAVRASVGFMVLPDDTGGLLLSLDYRTDGEPVQLPIRLQITRPHLGGVRWWFTCLLVNGPAPCRRRVSKLYLRGQYFGCRHCHRLTFRSCQEAHKQERADASWAKYGAEFEALMRRWGARSTD